METNPKAQAHPCSPQGAKAAILCQIVGHEGGRGRPGDAARDAWVTIHHTKAPAKRIEQSRLKIDFNTSGLIQTIPNHPKPSQTIPNPH